MPVDGYKHKRVWQYMFRPQPFAVLDRGWSGHDWEWERGVVERLRRGEAAPRGLSLAELHRTNGGGGPEGLEMSEVYARDANRLGSRYFSDEAIAKRASVRALQKQGQEEDRQRWRAEWAVQAERRKVAEAAWEEANRLWREKKEQEQATRDKRDSEWEEFRKRPLVESAEQTHQETLFILAHRWLCSNCQTLATVSRPEVAGGLYRMKCGCSERYWPHEKLMGLMRGS